MADLTKLSLRELLVAGADDRPLDAEYAQARRLIAARLLAAAPALLDALESCRYHSGDGEDDGMPPEWNHDEKLVTAALRQLNGQPDL